MNVIILSHVIDKISGRKLRKGDICMMLGDRHTQCGRWVHPKDERTERRPTHLVCREIFDAEQDRKIVL